MHRNMKFTTTTDFAWFAPAHPRHCQSSQTPANLQKAASECRCSLPGHARWSCSDSAPSAQPPSPIHRLISSLLQLQHCYCSGACLPSAPPDLPYGRAATVRLRERENLTHDTVRFRFSLPEGTALGLPVGKALKVRAEPRGPARCRYLNPRPADEARGRPAAPRCRGSGEGDVDAGRVEVEIVRKYTLHARFRLGLRYHREGVPRRSEPYFP